jgi:hydrogenase maturation protease
MTTDKLTVLLIGYGNPGRLDDGLGPALAERIEKLQLPGVTVEANYQLNVEDAEQSAGYDVVVFADASVNAPEPFSFYRIDPKADVSFTTHSIEPESVLGLAHDLFNAQTKGYILAVRGYEFNEFGQQLSDRSNKNLDAAVDFLKEAAASGNYFDYNK